MRGLRGSCRTRVGAGHVFRWLSGAVLAGVFVVGGCATSHEMALMPAAGYATVAGSSLAVEARGGVTIAADGNAWQGWPQNLPTVLTPVWVTIQNTSGHPVRVQYHEFTLNGQSGKSYTAMAPYAVQTPGPRVTVSAPNPGYFDDFYVADYLAPYYPWLPVWNGPFNDWPPSYAVTWRPHMPTASMIDQALPEGVLQPGGRMSGYLYFPKLPKHENAVVLRADLHTPAGNQHAPRQVAVIDIPFHVLR